MVERSGGEESPLRFDPRPLHAEAVGVQPDAGEPNAEAAAQRRLAEVGRQLEGALPAVLTPEQVVKFKATFGSGRLVAWRLGKERPIQR